jgi:hypothetical protein
MHMSYVYLASPYSHPDPAVRRDRHDKAAKAAARLMQMGIAVFAPIPHSVAIEAYFNEPESFSFWMGQDLPILGHAERLVVLRLPGWDVSRGVKREIEFATNCDIPIDFIDE